MIARFYRALFLILNVAFLTLNLNAQVQQAWVVKYNNGVASGQHQALKLALDSSGSIVVTGFSQNTNGGTGYATLKFAPNGTQLWVARVDMTNVPRAAPASFAVDVSNSVVTTGNAGTVKYDTTGSLLWSNAYTGASTATDTNCNVFITGFGTNLDTVKLSASGTNLWTQTYIDRGPTVGQIVAADSAGNCYVAGFDVYQILDNSTYQGLLAVRWNQKGTLDWDFKDEAGGGFNQVIRVSDVFVDPAENTFLLFDGNGGNAYLVDKIDTSGNEVWQASNLTDGFGGVSRSLAVTESGQTVCAGTQSVYPYDACWGTYALGANGTEVWSKAFPSFTATSTNEAEALALNSAGEAFITGFGFSGVNDIVTIAYDTNGKQLWLQRYTGLGYGAVGNAIACDNNGNVYVAGYENVPGGGSEMVLIKYSPVTLQHQSNGNFLLQAQGSPGEPFDIQASTNLESWNDLGVQDADTNGLLQYLDTNASLFPWRFYLAVPQ